MYYVYLIKNKASGEIYIGYSKDLKRRISEHGHKNPDLIYYEAYKTEADARKRELKLKHHGQATRRLKERLAESLK